MAEQQLFETSCEKCGSSFTSTDIIDADGTGRCLPCKEKTKKIAENVQKIIDQRRASRPPAPPRRELPTMPGTSYINARDLRL